jgi:hypothetical protein
MQVELSMIVATKKKLRIQLCNQLGEESMIDPHNFH